MVSYVNLCFSWSGCIAKLVSSLVSVSQNKLSQPPLTGICWVDIHSQTVTSHKTPRRFTCISGILVKILCWTKLSLIYQVIWVMTIVVTWSYIKTNHTTRVIIYPWVDGCHWILRLSSKLACWFGTDLSIMYKSCS